MFYYHVHVTGMPIDDKAKRVVRTKLTTSLDKNSITGYRIISSGTLFSKQEVIEPNYFHFF